MYVTIQQNKMGHLHIWLHERLNIEQSAKYNYVDTKGAGATIESDIYLQNDTDILDFFQDVFTDLENNIDYDNIKAGKTVCILANKDYINSLLPY